MLIIRLYATQRQDFTQRGKRGEGKLDHVHRQSFKIFNELDFWSGQKWRGYSCGRRIERGNNMRFLNTKSWKTVAVAALVCGLTLSGCTTSNFAGSSSYGGSNVKVADIENKGTYTADSALFEAKNHFKNNNFGYSAAFYKRAVELAPKDSEGYIGLSASYDMLGRFELADRVYTAWYKLNGPSVRYYNNLGYSLMLRGNLKSAYVNFKKAEKIEPDSIVVANNMQLLSDAAAKAG